jgi:hypothetical protein
MNAVPFSLFYNRPTLSDWYDWLRLGGALFFPIMAILSYFIMRENWSVKEEERAYVLFTPIILCRYYPPERCATLRFCMSCYEHIAGRGHGALAIHVGNLRRSRRHWKSR